MPTRKVSLFYWSLLAIILVSQRPCLARLEAAVILPHGDFAFDPFLVNSDPAERKAALRVAQSSRRAAHDFLDQYVNPDVILLVTPHGITLSHEFGIYLGQRASGFADIGTDLHNDDTATYRVNLQSLLLAPNLAHDLVQHMSGMNVTGIKTSADDSEDMPLEWGEVIPLLLVNNSNPLRQHLIWSQPMRRFGPSEGTDMVDELLRLGQRVFHWIEEQPQKFAVLVSADMSHTHRADGPYGYSNASTLFDKSIQKWAMSPCHKQEWLLPQHATSLQPRALSCGYTGMVFLHGMLCSGGSSREHSLRDHRWQSDVLVSQNVTYYGMMVATMRRIDTTAANQ